LFKDNNILCYYSTSAAKALKVREKEREREREMDREKDSA